LAKNFFDGSRKYFRQSWLRIFSVAQKIVFKKSEFEKEVSFFRSEKQFHFFDFEKHVYYFWAQFHFDIF